jgi:hypothetical protein
VTHRAIEPSAFLKVYLQNTVAEQACLVGGRYTSSAPGEGNVKTHHCQPNQDAVWQNMDALDITNKCLVKSGCDCIYACLVATTCTSSNLGACNTLPHQYQPNQKAVCGTTCKFCQPNMDLIVAWDMSRDTAIPSICNVGMIWKSIPVRHVWQYTSCRLTCAVVLSSGYRTCPGYEGPRHHHWCFS